MPLLLVAIHLRNTKDRYVNFLTNVAIYILHTLLYTSLACIDEIHAGWIVNDAITSSELRQGSELHPLSAGEFKIVC